MTSQSLDLNADPMLPPEPDRGAITSFPLTVSEVNRRAKRLIEAHFELIWVRGELSNVTRAASGHWYFSLKDETAQVRCVMFRNRAAAVGFVPENGQQVEIRALPSMYEPRGEFQLGVENMRRAGLGALFERFERLKSALRAEGLFDEKAKRAPPRFPKAVGIVTSLAAAALQDVLTTLNRRAPMINVVIYPASVQGAGSAAELAAALDRVRERKEVEVLILCRGGGSIEDLWSFNEEPVARAVARIMAETNIVVVSGVGHESDFTIVDFVADVRAPTPTAAAELVSPDVVQLRSALTARQFLLKRTLIRHLERWTQSVDLARQRLLSPTERIAREKLRVQWMTSRLRQSMNRILSAHTQQIQSQRNRLLPASTLVERHGSKLNALELRLYASAWNVVTRATTRYQTARNALMHLDPRLVLSRGYAIVEHRGVVIRRATQSLIGDNVTVRLAEGSLVASVSDTSRW